MDWKPIESAPRDGRDLLLWDERPYIGSWRKDDNVPKDGKMWLDNSYDDFSVGYASTPLKPTHWAAIDPPPSDASR